MTGRNCGVAIAAASPLCRTELPQAVATQSAPALQAAMTPLLEGGLALAEPLLICRTGPLMKLGCLPWNPSRVPRKCPCRGHTPVSGTGNVTQTIAKQAPGMTLVSCNSGGVPSSGNPSKPLETAFSVSQGGWVVER